MSTISTPLVRIGFRLHVTVLLLVLMLSAAAPHADAQVADVPLTATIRGRSVNQCPNESGDLHCSQTSTLRSREFVLSQWIAARLLPGERIDAVIDVSGGSQPYDVFVRQSEKWLTVSQLSPTSFQLSGIPAQQFQAVQTVVITSPKHDPVEFEVRTRTYSGPLTQCGSSTAIAFQPNATQAPSVSVIVPTSGNAIVTWSAAADDPLLRQSLVVFDETAPLEPLTIDAGTAQFTISSSRLVGQALWNDPAHAVFMLQLRGTSTTSHNLVVTCGGSAVTLDHPTSRSCTPTVSPATATSRGRRP